MKPDMDSRLHRKWWETVIMAFLLPIGIVMIFVGMVRRWTDREPMGYYGDETED